MWELLVLYVHDLSLAAVGPWGDDLQLLVVPGADEAAGGAGAAAPSWHIARQS